ncbi:MAG: RNA polymerase sigma-70 factor [Cyclobacteriaceae bacterium]
MTNLIDFDVRLTKQIKDGNTMAFHEIYSRHWKSIFGIAYSFLKNKQEAEDAVQDIFIKFWTKRDKLTANQDYKAYLFSIARNSLVNIVKSCSKNRMQAMTGIEEPGLNYTENELEYNELNELVIEAINEMPEKRQVIFELKRKEGLDTAQIAQEMGISKTMVQKHLKLANTFIKEYLLAHAN